MFFKSKPFDLKKYLINDLNYVISAEYPSGLSLKRDAVSITILSLSKLNQQDKVTISFLGKDMATLNYIPKSKTMFDIMLNEIISLNNGR